jgi:ribonuclease HII
MARMHEVYPAYDFLTHKGYITPTHTAALEQHGPCAIHRRRFVNVRRAEGEPVTRFEVEVGENGDVIGVSGAEVMS